MVVYQAFRFELDPNDRVRAALASHAGASRFAYNWGLALVKARLERREQIRRAALAELLADDEVDRLARSIEVPWTLPSQRQEWNRDKAEAAPWWRENSKEAYSAGLDSLARALGAFSASRSASGGRSVGFPRFKKRWARRSCRFSTGAIKVVDDRHVQLPRLGRIRTKEPTTKLAAPLAAGTARLLSATIAEEAGRWFVSFGCQVERADLPARYPGVIVGVDLGVKHLAVLSTGKVIENPKALDRYRRRMARLGRELSRRQTSSRRRAATRTRLARTHARVAKVRRDALHKLTTELASTYGAVVVEDLNVAGMTAKPKPKPEPERGTFAHSGRRAKAGLNRAVLDVSPAEFRRQLTYKLAWRGGTLVVAQRFFPSSKTCSSCGETKAKLSLATRTYRCQCGLEIDRDLNAALNLAAYGRRVVAGSGPETQNARGGGHPRPRPQPPVKREDGTVSAGKSVTASSQDEAA